MNSAFSMIVKNEELALPSCLSMLKVWSMKLCWILASYDRTEIAREFGARVFMTLNGVMVSPKPAIVF